MAKKQTGWKTKGMNRDLSVSAFNPEFAFENMNLRLSTNDSNTTLSWVNERGTAAIGLVPRMWDAKNPELGMCEIEIVGTPIGTAVLNHTLVLFTHQEPSSDRIYAIKYEDPTEPSMKARLLYQGSLNLDAQHPLETLVSYESEKIQKIYWVDGKNQPRVINIAAKNISDKPNTYFDFIPTLQLNETVTVKKILGGNGTFAPGVIQYAFTYYNRYGQESNIFYTTPLYYISHKDRGASPEDKVDNAFKITVKNVDKNFDYLRIYSIQRTSINGTPICKRIQDIYLEDSYDATRNEGYLCSYNSIPVTKNGMAIGPDKQGVVRNVFGTNVSCIGYTKSVAGDIEVSVDGKVATFGASSTGDSIIWITTNRITYNGVTAYFVVESKDLASSGTTEPLAVYVKTLSFVDTGTSGDSVDPTELLYKGGEAIVPNTIEQKDGTLFLGNFRNDRESLNDLKDRIHEAVTVTSDATYGRTIKIPNVSSGDYKYGNQLTAYTESGESIPCGGFKKGDYYRCGLQFQHKTGRWSEPIFWDDIEVKSSPAISEDAGTVALPRLWGKIQSSGDNSIISDLVGRGYVKVRSVVVFPEMKDRVTLCQGVAAPTVYTANHRTWEDHGETKGNNDLYAQSSWFFRFPYSGDQIDGEGAVIPYYYDGGGTPMPYASSLDDWNPSDIKAVEIQGDFNEYDQFRIDNGFVTLHSPDMEFDTQLFNASFLGVRGSCVGHAEIAKTLSDIEIQTETPTVSNNGNGFIHKAFSKSKSSGIVSGLFYEDFAVDDDGDDDKNLRSWSFERSPYKWMVYLWNKEGSLNNDINRPADRGTPTAVLKKKITSNLRITDTSYINDVAVDISQGFTPEVFASDETTVIKVGGKVYQGNVDTMLAADKADGMYFAFSGTALNDEVETPFTEAIKWKTYSSDPDDPNETGIKYWDENRSMWDYADGAIGNKYVDLVIKKPSIRMKYKSTPHIVTRITRDLDYWNTLWQDDKLPIIELRHTYNANTAFGGKSTDALKENNWVPCGEPQPLLNPDGTPKTVQGFSYDYGDTYFQRWDCLKTYAFTPEDVNQVVEIGSFMLETHVNIDGRYDRNRGQVNNTYMSPRNFNLINEVYSQKDNFFTYKILDDSYYDNTKYLNQITWSLTKEAGADVDLWTNITLASVLELDGDKGELNKLIRFNNFLFAFQDTGISQILYNDNVQIQSTQGVPIEIANSGKVSGKDYKSSSIGCSNKWSMVTTPNGIYFMDSNDKNIYLFNGQLSNVSGSMGFNSWAKQNIPAASEKWNPETFSTFTSFYDRLNQDVLFVNSEIALAYSERLGAFTSFYNYGDAPFFVNLDDTGIWIKDNILWKHNAGGYCEFFGEKKPYWTILVGNPEPQLDKIFTNLEFRACVEGDGELDQETGKFTPTLPFDYLETWNEYQRGVAFLSNRNAADAFRHNDLDGNASLKRKFRIWRCDIPRNNFERLSGSTFDLTFDYTFRPRSISRKTNDRMRNPWLYLKLMKNAEDEMQKTEVHDLVMTYFT